MVTAVSGLPPSSRDNRTAILTDAPHPDDHTRPPRSHSFMSRQAVVLATRRATPYNGTMLKKVLLNNYEDPDGPIFQGNYASPRDPNTAVDTAVLVSYNIEFGMRMPQATSEFKIIDPLPQSDVILLQEVDEHGTNRMARVLGYNFVYFPASVHRHGRNFGNAILSRWPILNPTKFILPRRAPGTRQLRLATRAEIALGSTRLLAYSVHTEVYHLTSRKHRRQQVEAIVEDIQPGRQPVIVGGDFNTVRRAHIKRLEQQFGSIGMARVTRGIGPTIRKYRVQPSAADHIFARGIEVEARGKIPQVLSSDHFPVWVRLRPNNHHTVGESPE